VNVKIFNLLLRLILYVLAHYTW